MEQSKGAVKKVDSELVAYLRELGLHETLTFFSDGAYQVNLGGGKVSNGTWTQTGYNELELEGFIEAEGIKTAVYDEDIVPATISSGRMTVTYEDRDNGTVKLVYSKQ